ncbi:MAG: type II 3-dehydroquinate dehydratase [Pseudomonadota bacterium]
MAKPIFVLNGPNLNMLGTREPAVYGSTTLKDIEGKCHDTADELGLSVDFRQSNHEGDLVGWLQEANSAACGVVLNAAAYTHTSIALYDAVKGGDIPVIELHISNVHAREPFRTHSYISPVATGVILGFGTAGYPLAIRALKGLIEKQ